MGTIHNTTDGGTNWTSQTSGTSNELTDVHFVDANTGWAVGQGVGTGGSDSNIRKTTDGGSNWNGQTSGTSNWLNRVYFVDENTGWAVGSSGTILNTTDGGTTWGAQTSGTANALYGVHFIDENTGWVVGNNGTVRKTTDGGANWNLLPNPGSYFLRSVYFNDKNNGWVVGWSLISGNNFIIRTSNGGSSWGTPTTGTTDRLMDVHFIDKNTGWTVGYNGLILYTSDEGNTWNTRTSGTSNILSGVYFVDANTGWAISGNGDIIKYDVALGGGGGGGRISVFYETDSSPVCPLSGLTASTVVEGGARGGTTAEDGDGDEGTLNVTQMVCGDGTQEGNETCDDNNTSDGDGCDSQCRNEVCGNGYIQTGENCDDWNTNDDDGCSSSCTIEIGWSCSGEPSSCWEVGHAPLVCPSIDVSVSNLFSSLVQVDENTGLKLSWVYENPDQSNIQATLYRGIGENIQINQMVPIKTFYSLFETEYTDLFTQDRDYGKTYTYAIQLIDNCGNTTKPVYSSISLPVRLEEGETIDLTVNIEVKIKEVRDDLLLDRIRSILEEHQNQQTILKKELVAQLTSDVSLNQTLDEFWIKNEIREAIIQAFFPDGIEEATPLELEFYEAHKDFIFYMTLGYLAENEYLPLTRQTNLNELINVMQVYVNERVGEILSKVYSAEEAKQALTDALGTLIIDPNSLTSIDAILGNSELKEAILAIPNITNLIKGHSDTLTLEVWNPGDRSEPLYSETIQTNLFGETSVVLKDFVTGTYDFTIHRDFVRRRALNGVNVRTSTLFLNFKEEELKWGDFDNNLEINSEDILALPEVFSENPRNLDITEDDIFNLMDVLEMFQNWGAEDF